MEITNSTRRATITERANEYEVARYCVSKTSKGWRFLAVGRLRFKKRETALKQANQWVESGKY